VVCPGCLDGLSAPAVAWVGSGDGALDDCRSLVCFDGPGRDLVVALKYRNGRHLGHLLGAAMAALVDPAEVDVVTWAPTTRVRRQGRGYDQSRLLARGVAREIGRPWRPLLGRGSGPPQTGRSLVERQIGPRFSARGVPPPSVLLVDDVVTTGATLEHAARALRAGGAQRVVALTAARTLSRSDRLAQARSSPSRD
jgi:predicted amidophosphoribosyltransferase